MVAYNKGSGPQTISDGEGQISQSIIH